MLTLRFAVLASLALARPGAARADGFAPAGPASQPSLSYTGKPFPPPGLPEDQALLRDLIQTQGEVVGQRALGLRTIQRLADDRSEPRLAEAVRKAPPGDRDRLDALHGRFVAAWERVRDLLVRQWPVDPRMGCRQRGIELEVVMSAGLRDPASPQLATAREEARRCLARQQVPVSQLREANAELQATLPLVRAALGGASPPPVAAAAPDVRAAPAAAPVAPATATTGR